METDKSQINVMCKCCTRGRITADVVCSNQVSRELTNNRRTKTFALLRSSISTPNSNFIVTNVMQAATVSSNFAFTDNSAHMANAMDEGEIIWHCYRLHCIYYVQVLPGHRWIVSMI